MADTDVNPISEGLENAFLDGFKESDRSFIQERGFKSNDDVAAALRKAAEFDGVDLKSMVALPGEDATPEKIAEFYAKLGRPETAEGYKYQVPEGDDGAFAKGIMPILFDAGITQKQLDAIIPKWNELQSQLKEAQEKALSDEDAKARDGLKTKWGADYDKNIAFAKRAAQSAGFTANEIDALAKIKGSAFVYEIMAKFGKLTGDADILGADGGKTGAAVSDPAEAKSRIARLMNDKDFAAKYAANDPEAVKTWNDLHTAAYGGH